MQEKLRTYKASIFQALAHPTRIAILELLRGFTYLIFQIMGHPEPPGQDVNPLKGIVNTP
jgi:DNA-binding transcriptional ArsR family regulator